MSRVKQSAPLRAASGIAMALVAGISALAPVAAYAQNAPAQTAPAQGQQPPAGPSLVQLKAEPSQADWTKVCGRDEGANKEICYTTRDFVSEQGQPVLAVAIYDVKGDATKIVRFLMPLGLLLRPGLRFFVDKNDPVAGQYAICFPNGCFAEAPVPDAFINSLKRGNILNVSAQNQMGREVTFAVPLAGFTKGFDGKPIDPQALEAQQRQLQEALQKRSEELRQRSGQPGQGGAPAAPAAPAQQ
ncbi:invasion protein IalB [Pseudochelatococcus lubricantis]|uniref:Invasion protein IalB n=1 Tax=Pseudochelatococcus lubricantis TaxID=1538102 RepID=A0ABX0UVY6_9HYPH|nr:invasion associated locus B family protein [Pseudochelatococcus lubricantis]NIJ56563.1 invasion protein IalB [Pseudochelatococcus lubricantis]